jgi:hypothetical protein
MTIGASSERRVDGRVLIPIVRCVEAVVEFVMAFPSLVGGDLVWKISSHSSGLRWR